MSDINPKIAIIGYGSMGREIEKQAIEKGFTITDIFEIDNPVLDTKKYDFDVAIDFSFPDSVLDNVSKLSRLKKNIVLGTTGWKQHEKEIKNLISDNNTGMVYGSNYSIGMNVFFNIVKKASSLIDMLPDYDVMINEIHHARKKDSPSGTALSIAEIILNNIARKTKILDVPSKGAIEKDALHVTSSRVGDVTGTHTVFIDSPADTIELIHRAKNRSGFALGALLAAQWIYGKKGYYNLNDVLNDVWKKD